ncbi:N-acetyltransferase [Aneurinibacillus thermoaerophilus]|uniref:N-acetyltransferase n=1 Tax=Aneurinibacillus TaxID=55079 RepID=UPI00070FCACB|nr:MULTISPECIES: N-acetyltransferase [Aneurinibacillus]AMA73964.1 hypothetical protein ACH33_14720 [Aneurinibacillus sp. XH2]MED0678150.1 N-acetyltransferase [Aneurinibacillus thermoaerophilus]
MHEDVLIGDLSSIREDVVVEESSIIGRNVIVEPATAIGKRVTIQTGSYITANMIIEDEVFIGPCCSSSNDKYMGMGNYPHKGPMIKRGAKIGNNATLLPGITIGEKAIESYQNNLALEEGWVEDKIYACIFMADCYRSLGDFPNELTSLLKSFQYAKPKAEAICRIGYHFLRKKDYKTAAAWFEFATRLTIDSDQWSFSYPAYHTWYPHLQLCICHYYLGDYQKAYEHNEEARKYRPEDNSVLHNKRLLESKLGILATNQ